MKKLLSVFLTFLMLFACLGLVACSDGGNDSGSDAAPGLACEIKEDDDGNKYAVATSYTISADDAKKVANGEYDEDLMVDLVIDTYKYEGKTYPIKEIATNCFSNQLVIRSVKFSENVEKFGSACLSGCVNLESLEIPFVGATVDAVNAQKVLGYLFGSAVVEGASTISMMYNESNSQSFTIPNSLKEVTVTGDKVSDYAFYGMNLETVNLVGNVETIGKYTFAEMQYLKSYEIPETVTKIGKGAFKNCSNLAMIDFSKATGLTEIGSEAFYGCSLLGYGKNTQISLPNSLKSLGEKAFYNCTSLTTIDLSATAISVINEYTFYNCKELKEVKLLPAVKLTLGVFGKCEKLDKTALKELEGAEYAFDIEMEEDEVQE